ncbi:MAG: FAD binding domain-containing protein [Chloroflexi bacterium]|nr:FAD binding domain-containing protein [Chloroflexota bacterium]
MRLPAFDHIAPQTLDDAMAVKAQHSRDSWWLAGGTDLVVRMRHRVAEPGLVISLNSIPSLGNVSFAPADGLRLGALVSLCSLETSPVVAREYEILSQAARRIASPQIRNAGTVGGNLCIDTRCWYFNQSRSWRQGISTCFKTGGDLCHVVKHGKRCYALFKGDLVPALIALGATVVLASDSGQRVIPLQELYRNDGANHLTLSPSEMVTGVQVPPLPAGCGTAFVKHTYRSEIDFGIASVAALIELDRQGLCSGARVIIGGVSSAPVKASAAEAALQGNKLSDSLAREASSLAIKDIGAIVSIGATPDYKRRIVRHVVSQVITDAWQQAGSKMAGR